MHVYIDESGIFSNPNSKPNVASVVAALIIPSTYKAQVFAKFKELTAEWPHEDDEIKGRLLDEAQIAAAIGLLREYDSLVEVNVIDLGIHTEEELAEFQKGTCEMIAGWATDEHSEEFRKQVAEVSTALQKPKSPLFVESFLLTVLIPRILNIATNYYARRLPKELGNYHWVVDAKEKYVTDFEQAWYTTIFPSIRHQTIQNPILRIQNGDYTYLEPFYSLPPDLAAQAERDLRNEPDKMPFDVGPIFKKDFKFQDSKENIGLQLADIVANGIQRALNGKLKEEGYACIGGLFVLQEDLAIRIIRMDPNAEEYHAVKVKSPFHDPINKMLKNAKPIWVSPEQEEYLAIKARRRNKKKFGYGEALKQISKPSKVARRSD